MNYEPWGKAPLAPGSVVPGRTARQVTPRQSYPPRSIASTMPPPSDLLPSLQHTGDEAWLATIIAPFHFCKIFPLSNLFNDIASGSAEDLNYHKGAHTENENTAR